jgi:hypothetical protein
MKNNIEIVFDLIKIKWGITILRPLNILLIFLPIYANDKIDLVKNTNFWGGWSLFWILVFIIQVLFLKRYKIIGQIKLINNSISIIENVSILFFNFSNQNLSIVFKYNGYKGERGNYESPLQIPIFPRDGIGSLFIIKEKLKYKYFFVSKKNNYEELTLLAELIRQTGNKVDLRFNKSIKFY